MERKHKDSPVLDCHGYPEVCKIILDKDSYGTGFLGKFTLNGNDTHGLFTNNHVVKQPRELTLEFHLHREAAANKSECTKSVEVKVSSDEIHKFFTCSMLDATFIEFGKDLVDKIKRMTSGFEVNYLPLINEVEYQLICEKMQAKNDSVQATVLVTGYPGDETEHPDCTGSKKYAQGPLCRIEGFNLIHRASTTRGSSGSPLFINNKVVGLHKWGSCNDNVATAVVDILQAIERANKPQDFQPPSKEEVEGRGMKSRFNPKRGRVYSYKSGSSEIWVTPTSHGWHCTRTDPSDLEEDEHIFDFLTWQRMDGEPRGDN